MVSAAKGTHADLCICVKDTECGTAIGPAIWTLYTCIRSEALAMTTLPWSEVLLMGMRTLCICVKDWEHVTNTLQGSGLLMVGTRT